jgi:gliding motility-associated-like protein
MKRAIKITSSIRVCKIFLGLLFTLVLTQTKAATPNWTISPADYQYTMTVTAVLDVNCKELTSTSNMLGAFVNGECRGKISSATIYNGKYLALITVYSNVAKGESVSFKIYEAATDKIHDPKNIVTFENNAKFGSLNNPYSVFTSNRPSDIALSSTSADENVAVGTVIGALSTTDADVSDTHSYSFVSGIGDTNNSQFAISADKIQTNAALNYEAQSSYSVLVKTQDSNGCSFTKQFTITVNNVNDQPTNIALSNSTVTENNSANATIGTLTSEDQDGTAAFTYSLVTGAGDADNGSFTIEGNVLKATTVFDFETKNTFSVRIRTSDGSGGTFEKAFTINCTNANDAPTDINLSNLNLAENLPVGTTVGTLTSSDPDLANTFTYSFANVTNSDNGKFVIVGDQLRTSTFFNFEEKSIYYIYLQTKDNAGSTFEKQLIINITDGNDAPTELELSNQSILAGKPVGTVIGSFSPTDSDAGDTFAYSLVSGTGDSDNDSFDISGSSLVSKRAFSYKANKFFSIRVKVEDASGGIFSKQFSIQIKDINNGPTDIKLSSNAVVENTSLGTIIGTFSTTDSNTGDGHIYTFEAGVGGEDNSAFTIAGNSLRTNSAYNYEAKSSYSILVKTEDGDGGSFTKQFTIAVTNANDAPFSMSLSKLSVEENKEIGFAIGLFSTEDEDSGDNHTYSFVNSSYNDNSRFQLIGKELKANAIFDFESKETYLIEVKVEDGKGGTLLKQFDITILNTNDAPNDLKLSKETIEENKPIGTTVCSFLVTDQDNGDTHAFSLIPGTGAEDNHRFSIYGNQLMTREQFNYNSKSQFSILVEVTDSNGSPFKKQFLVEVTDANNAPTAINLDGNQIEENSPASSYIGTLRTIDEDKNDQFKYSLVAGAGGKDSPSFKLEGDKLYTAASLDFESKPTLEIRIKSEDATGASFETTFVINVVDINEKPVVKDVVFTVAENTSIGEIVGLIEWIDIDKNQILNYSVIDKNVPFEINPSNGEISLTGALNFEIAKEYSFSVVATDNAQPQLSDTASIKISIEDKVEVETEAGVFPANNYMSPNGDGKNDFWEVENVEQYKDFELRVFNGNGELVYHKKSDYQNDWDGTFEGEKLPTGYYMYYFKKDKEVYKGIISIIR